MAGQNIFLDGYYGHNGDDCVSVVNGANGIVAKNGYCGFSSHGLSIGSLGRNGSQAHVANVLFQNWTMDGAVYGARVSSASPHPLASYGSLPWETNDLNIQFKSWTGGQGLAENVTYRDITVLNVSTPIFITQK